MAINTFQKSTVKDYLSFPFSTITGIDEPFKDDTNDNNTQIDALRLNIGLLGLTAIFDEDTYTTYQSLFAATEILTDIEQVKEILLHEYPQNRREGDYMSVGQEPGMAVWLDRDDLVEYQDQEGNKAYKPKVKKEPTGLLSLTAKNNSENINNPVTKTDVVNYIAECIQAQQQQIVKLLAEKKESDAQAAQDIIDFLNKIKSAYAKLSEVKEKVISLDFKYINYYPNIKIIFENLAQEILALAKLLNQLFIKNQLQSNSSDELMLGIKKYGEKCISELKESMPLQFSFFVAQTYCQYLADIVPTLNKDNIQEFYTKFLDALDLLMRRKVNEEYDKTDFAKIRDIAIDAALKLTPKVKEIGSYKHPIGFLVQKGLVETHLDDTNAPEEIFGYIKEEQDLIDLLVCFESNYIKKESYGEATEAEIESLMTFYKKFLNFALKKCYLHALLEIISISLSQRGPHYGISYSSYFSIVFNKDWFITAIAYLKEYIKQWKQQDFTIKVDTFTTLKNLIHRIESNADEVKIPNTREILRELFLEMIGFIETLPNQLSAILMPIQKILEYMAAFSKALVFDDQISSFSYFGSVLALPYLANAAKDAVLPNNNIDFICDIYWNSIEGMYSIDEPYVLTLENLIGYFSNDKTKEYIKNKILTHLTRIMASLAESDLRKENFLLVKFPGHGQIATFAALEKADDVFTCLTQPIKYNERYEIESKWHEWHEGLITYGRRLFDALRQTGNPEIRKAKVKLFIDLIGKLFPGYSLDSNEKVAQQLKIKDDSSIIANTTNTPFWQKDKARLQDDSIKARITALYELAMIFAENAGLVRLALVDEEFNQYTLTLFKQLVYRVCSQSFNNNIFSALKQTFNPYNWELKLNNVSTLQGLLEFIKVAEVECTGLTSVKAKLTNISNNLISFINDSLGINNNNMMNNNNSLIIS